MALILQNAMEIFFHEKVKRMFKKKREWADNTDGGRAKSYQADALLSDDDQQAKGVYGLFLFIVICISVI